MKKLFYLLPVCILFAVGCKKNSEIIEPPPPPPDVDFEFAVKLSPFQNVVIFTAKSITATSYSWDFGDNTTAEGSAAQHTYQVGGTYSVTLTAKGPGGEVKKTKQVTVASPYTKLNITQINLDYYTFKLWDPDNGMGGFNADVYFVIEQGSFVLTSSENNPIYNNTHTNPVSWVLTNIQTSQFNEPVVITFWDYDNPTGNDPNDFMLSVSFKPADFALNSPWGPYPKTLRFTSANQDTYIEVECDWE